jgi:hypothetical protein
MSKFPRIPFIALLLVAGAASICHAQNPDATKKTAPENCEIHSLILDMMRNEVVWGSGKDSLVIAIARLGRGEISRELNKRRLYNLGVHWKDYGLPAERLILVEGERVNGYGRVDLYVSGKLFDVLLVERRKDLCVDCCDIDERLYPYRDKKRRS